MKSIEITLNNCFNRGKSAVYVAMLSFGVAGIVQAQPVIEEIMVTAQKRTQSAQDIGVVITSLSDDLLKKLNLKEAHDLAAHTPGLTTTYGVSGGNPIFNIRGVGADDYNSNNSSGVGVYIDEVYASFPAFLTGQIFDVERMEVLKGPQGTLYGKNATGGAINYISKRPTEEREGYISVGYGRYDTFDVTGAVSGPIADTLKGRVAIKYADGDGYQQDIDTGKDYGTTDRFATKLLLEFTPTDRVAALLNLHYSKDDSVPPTPLNFDNEVPLDGIYGTTAGILDFFGTPIEGLIDSPSDDPSQVRVGSFDQKRDEEGYGISLKLDVDFEWGALTSITAWDTYDTFVNDSFDGMPGAHFDYLKRNEVEQFSQELRLTSNSDIRTEWVAGINYSYDEIDDGDGFDFTQSFGFDLTANGLSLVFNDYIQESKSIGVYLHTETHLTEKLDLIVGLRYTNDNRSFDGRSIDPFGTVSFTFVPDTIIDTLDETHRENDVSYRLGLEYALSEDMLLFGSVATGYKAGAFYGYPAYAPGIFSYIAPENVLTYEFGIKSSLLDDTLRLNASYFHTGYDDRQSVVSALDPASGVVLFLLDTVPKTDIDGIEIEATWQVNTEFRLQGGLSWIESSIEGAATTARDGTLPLITPIVDGQALSFTPEWQFNVIANYQHDLNEKYYSNVQIDYTWQDKTTSLLADPFGGIEIQRGLGANFSIATTDEKWEVSAWGTNLTDENAVTYSYSAFYSPGRVTFHQVPRTYGVNINYNF